MLLCVCQSARNRSVTLLKDGDVKTLHRPQISLEHYEGHNEEDEQQAEPYLKTGR